MWVLWKENIKKKIKVCCISLYKRCTQILRRNFNLVLHHKVNCYCLSCFLKNTLSSENDKFPKNDQNQLQNSFTIFQYNSTLNSNKSDFYNSWNSIEVLFDDDNHHILINSKYFNINETNTLKTKAPMMEQAFLLTKSIYILSEVALTSFHIKILNNLLFKPICQKIGISSVTVSINILICQ